MKIKEHVKKWKAIPCFWVGKISIVKMATLPKAIYRFSTIPNKLPMTFFTELEQTIQKFIWNHKRPKIAKAILRNKNQAGGITLPHFRQYYEASHQDSVVLVPKQTHRPVEQNREPRNKPWHLWSINLWQRRQEHKMGESLFSKNCWETWTVACKSMKLECTLTPCTKINSKWLKDLNRWKIPSNSWKRT